MCLEDIADAVGDLVDKELADALKEFWRKPDCCQTVINLQADLRFVTTVATGRVNFFQKTMHNFA